MLLTNEIEIEKYEHENYYCNIYNKCYVTHFIFFLKFLQDFWSVPFKNSINTDLFYWFIMFFIFLFQLALTTGKNENINSFKNLLHTVMIKSLSGFWFRFHIVDHGNLIDIYIHLTRLPFVYGMTIFSWVMGYILVICSLKNWLMFFMSIFFLKKVKKYLYPFKSAPWLKNYHGDTF